MSVKDHWKQVKRKRIVNCWKKVGFIAPLPPREPDQLDQNGDEPMPNQDEDDASSEITEREEVVFKNIWDKLATVLQMELPDFKNYVEVDKGDIEVVVELVHQEIVLEVKSVNKQDDLEIESKFEPETEVAGVSTVQTQQAIDCLKRYIIKKRHSQGSKRRVHDGCWKSG